MNMKKILKSIVSFCGFNLIYGYPLYFICFFLLALIFGGFASGADYSSGQTAGWLAIIISGPIAGVLSIILSIVSTKKIFFRKIKEDGTKEKIPVILIVWIVISILLALSIFGYIMWNINRNSKELPENLEHNNIENSIKTYNVDVLENIYDYDDNSKYITNPYKQQLKDNNEENYILNFHNLKFQDVIYQFSYQINNNKKTITIDNKQVVNAEYDSENLLGITLYDNYYKISEFIENEVTITKDTIIDENKNIVYSFYDLSTYDDNISFEIVDDSNKNNVYYKYYNLDYIDNRFIQTNLIESSFDCKDYYNIENINTIEDNVKYYICNN